MQNPLTVIPAKYRRFVYAVLTLAALGLAAWKGAEGDWTEFVALLLGSLGFGTATANTPTAKPHDDQLRA